MSFDEMYDEMMHEAVSYTHLRCGRAGRGRASGARGGGDRCPCTHATVTRSVPVGEVRPLGDQAFLIGVKDAAAARLMVAELQLALARWSDAGHCEILGGLATVTIVCRRVDDAEDVEAAIGEVVRSPGGGAVEDVYKRQYDDSEGSQLIIHAPYGGRINRALGLALRKRFCVSFDFELQAAADDDTVVLSLGPQHSFPLSDVPGMLPSHLSLIHI